MRASTPVSSDVDARSIRSNDTSHSVAAPQNILLLSQDLTTSICSLTQRAMTQILCSKIISAIIFLLVFIVHYPLCDGYVHRCICYGYKLVGDNLDKNIDICIKLKNGLLGGGGGGEV